MKDPNFLTKPEKQKLDIAPLTGKELQALVTAAVSKPASVIAVREAGHSAKECAGAPEEAGEWRALNECYHCGT